MAHELTVEQIQESKSVFDKLKDAKETDEPFLAYDRLKDALLELNFEVTDEEVADLKSNMKLNADIDFPTFLRIAAAKFKDQEFVKELKSAFKAFDVDSSQSLTYDQLRSIITDYGPKLTLDQADKLLKDLGINESHTFDYNSYIKKSL